MEKNLVIRTIWIVVYILCACSFVLFWISVLKSPFDPNGAEQGKPFYENKVRLYWGEISDYLICNNRLYLLYDEKEALQCYSLDGEPLFSYIFRFRKNGVAHLHTDGNTLIVEDRRSNYYLFSSEGEFIEYITEKTRKEAIQDNFILKQEARTTKSGARYELIGASVVLVEEQNVIKKIVARPLWMAIFQHSRTLICTIILAAFIAARNYAKKH